MRIILLLLIAGCAKYEIKEQQEVVYFDNAARSEIFEYVDTFMYYLKQEECKQSFFITMRFYDQMDKNILGMCQKRTIISNGRLKIEGTIIINAEYWPQISYNSKMTLIAHELGHCVLNADHDESDPIMTSYHNTLDWSKAETIFSLKNLIKRNCWK